MGTERQPLKRLINPACSQTPPEPGKKITTPGGREVRVLNSTETAATLDFNHELAGKTLILEIKLVSIVK